MYARNAASPERIAIGAVVQISDGAVQTSGVSIKVKPQGTTASAGGGTTTYEEGIVGYVPTQAETDYTSFQVIAYKTGCIPAAVTIVTSASATAGYGGVDWSKVTAPTTTLALTGTTIATTQKVDVETIKTQAVTAAAGVTFPTSIASPTNITAGTITTVTNLTNAATAGDLTATMKTSIGTAVAASAVASVTGNVGGNVTGSVGSVTGLTNSTIADQVWDEVLSGHAGVGSTGAALSAAGGSGDPWSTALPGAYGAGTAGNIVGSYIDAAVSSRLSTAGYTAPPAAAAVADAVWDEVLSGHLTAGTTGNALNAAGAAGDPWTTSLPGAYGAGSAGYIIGTNIDALISSRMATYTQPTGFLAATFPGTVASTTNITAGTITTVTTLTNLPSIPANWLTAAGIAAGALDGKGNWNIGKTGYSLTTAPLDAAGVRGAVGLAAADLDTQLAALPTAAEVRAEIDSNSTKLASIETRGDNVVCRGTVSATSPTTTSFTASAMSPSGAAADQFKGRIIVFDKATTTAALRGQATDITANTSASLPVFTFTALTTAPVSGDSFSIV